MQLNWSHRLHYPLVNAIALTRLRRIQYFLVLLGKIDVGVLLHRKAIFKQQLVWQNRWSICAHFYVVIIPQVPTYEARVTYLGRLSARHCRLPLSTSNWKLQRPRNSWAHILRFPICLGAESLDSSEVSHSTLNISMPSLRLGEDISFIRSEHNILALLS